MLAIFASSCILLGMENNNTTTQGSFPIEHPPLRSLTEASQDTTVLERMRILGPTVRGTFCIATDDDLVWTPRGWRQFGRPCEFGEFREAWLQVETARAALVEIQATSAGRGDNNDTQHGPAS